MFHSSVRVHLLFPMNISKQCFSSFANVLILLKYLLKYLKYSSTMLRWFTKHPRKLWTWKSPDGITRNQIDYITINRRYRNTVTDIRTHPEADCNSDHIMLVGDIKMKFKRLKQQKSYSPNLDIKSLDKDIKVKEKFCKEVETKMETTNENQ